VDITLDGDGERTIVAQYVHEAPVWKTSYRLVLPADDAGDSRPLLQGWAIVENTSDDDWTDIRLSLASGQPSAFRMNLYEPLYSPRQEVAVPVPMAIASRVYDDAVRFGYPGSTADKDELGKSLRVEGGRVSSERFRAVATASESAGLPAPAQMDFNTDGLFDYPANVLGSSIASAAQTGDVFFYDVSTPVTIARQRSAMLPIVGDRVDGRRVSIHSPGDGPHPRAGVEMTNSSGLDLIAGPVAVYDGAAYAGDAQISDTGKGDERLLSYGLDSDVRIIRTTDSTSRTTTIKIVSGMFHLTSVQRTSTVYAIENHDEARDRALLIEYPRIEGAELVEPKTAREETQQLYRFEVAVPREGKAEFRTTQDRTQLDSISLLGMSDDTLAAHVSSGVRISQAVRDAFARAQQLQAELNEANRRVSATEARVKEVSEDQGRIRQNLQTIDRTSELASRLMKKLGEQETDLESLDTRVKEERDAAVAARNAINAYINSLNVE
jgi:hypothetical protein